jgi:hypothetical protein
MEARVGGDMMRDLLAPGLFALGSACFLVGNLILIWRVLRGA